MPYITEERRDAQLRNMLPAFISQATANATLLGLEPSELDALTSEASNYSDVLDQVEAAKNLLRSAVRAKKKSQSEIRALLAQFAKTWRADPAIPDNILAEMNVAPRQGQGSQSPPVTPTQVNYSINTEGVVRLRWKRNGNKPGTVFNVERSADGVTNWAVVNTSTSTKAIFQTAPGVTVYYRVVAIRGQHSSAPTNPIVVWPTADNAGQTTHLEAA